MRDAGGGGGAEGLARLATQLPALVRGAVAVVRRAARPSLQPLLHPDTQRVAAGGRGWGRGRGRGGRVARALTVPRTIRQTLASGGVVLAPALPSPALHTEVLPRPAVAVDGAAGRAHLVPGLLAAAQGLADRAQLLPGRAATRVRHPTAK